MKKTIIITAISIFFIVIVFVLVKKPWKADKPDYIFTYQVNGETMIDTVETDDPRYHEIDSLKRQIELHTKQIEKEK